MATVTITLTEEQLQVLRSMVETSLKLASNEDNEREELLELFKALGGQEPY